MRGTIPFLSGTPVGHYRLSVATGLTTGLAANNPIFSARWNSTVGIRASVLRFKISATIITAFTAAQEISAAAIVARAFTAVDSGGTPLVLTGLNNVQNSLSDVASIATINVATTSTLTAGTRTLDGNPFLQLSAAQLQVATSAVSIQNSNEYGLYSDMQFPFNLNAAAGSQEGVVVTVPVAQGAGGTVRYVIDMEWIEYNAQSNIGVIA